MPIASLKIQPSLDIEKTFTLNEAGMSQTQLVRVKDGLWQTFGGWVQWSPTGALAATPRVMLSWTDLNGTVYTAVGTDTAIYVINNNVATDLTPQITTTNPTPNFSATVGSPTITIVDPMAVPILGLAISLVTAISVGGLILQGGYNIASIISGTTYTITAASNATSTVANGGAVAVYTTVASQVAVNVLLNNHGMSVGSQWSEPISTTVGGITISGNYLVAAVVDANNFTIDAASPATSSASVPENGGNAQISYFIGSTGGGLANFGYGVGGYGLGGYGQGSIFVPSSDPPAPLWTVDHWGETLIACPGNGPIYNWTPGLGQTQLEIITTAPSVNGGIFVAMPAQILVAWASSINGSQQPNLVQWSDQLNFNSWTPTVTNQAGNATIPTGSRIVGAIQAPNQALIFTDIDVYAMNYLGGSGNIELVFGFIKIANGAGLLSARAVGVLNNQIFWLSPGQFLTLGSAGVVPIPCPIWDLIFQDLDTANLKKIVCGTNSIFNEVSWYYPSLSGGTGENDSYVTFNTIENGGQGAWYYGKMVRTAWQDYSAAGNPLGADNTPTIYQHETGTTANGQPMNWSFTTGAWMISEGNEMMFVDWLLPDYRYGLINNPTSNQSVTTTVYSYYYPSDTPVSSLPLTASSSGPGELSLRIRGRALQVSATGNGFFRMGNVRYRAAPDGRY
jgi:hypothetical protein